MALDRSERRCAGAGTLLFVGVAALVACAGTPHRAPAAPVSNCALEKVIGAIEDNVRRCDGARGDCDRDCRERMRTCILEAAAARAPFVALWDGSYYDGLGRRFAMAGRDAGDGYRIVQFEYIFASAYDARGVKEGVSRETIVSRTCPSLFDLRDECGPRGRQRGCNVGRSDREARLEIGCAAAETRTLCDEPAE